MIKETEHGTYRRRLRAGTNSLEKRRMRLSMCINASWGNIHNGGSFLLVLSDKAKSKGHILTIKTHEI